MHESHGELLLGGSRLHNVHVEIDEEQPVDGHADWLLSGRRSGRTRSESKFEIQVSQSETVSWFRIRASDT